MGLTFRAYRFFKIHDLTDSEKLTTGVISFDDLALDWYQAQEELEVFKNWADLKEECLYSFDQFEKELWLEDFSQSNRKWM